MKKNINSINGLLQKVISKRLDPDLKFHYLTRLNKLAPEQPSKDWPDSWKKIYFKRHLRFYRLRLSEYKTRSELEKILMSRKSQRNFSGKGVSLSDISYILQFSAGIREKKVLNWNSTTRPYPSAGARYPCEIYPIIFNVKGINPGIYHYDFKEHYLELLLPDQFNKKFVSLTGTKWVEDASLLILITSILGRSKVKYGLRAYRHTLIEAGHIGQNIYLTAIKRGLKCSAMGGYLDEEVEKMLDIDGKKEFVTYLLAIGV